MKHKIEMSSGGIVFKKDGREKLWLVTQHSQNKNWGFPKGLIGDTIDGEKNDQAALREVREEGGVTTRIVDDHPVSVSYTYQFEGTLVEKTVYYYLMEYLSGDPKDHDWEVSEAKFLPEGEVKKILTYQSDKEAFGKILLL